MLTYIIIIQVFSLGMLLASDFLCRKFINSNLNPNSTCNYSPSFNVMSLVKGCQYLDSLLGCFRVSNHCLSKESLECIPK